MKLIITSDIHCHFQETLELIKKFGGCDCILIAGDITNYGALQRNFDVFNDLNKAQEFLRECSRIAPTYYVMGNHDINLQNIQLANGLGNNVLNITDKSIPTGELDRFGNDIFLQGMNLTTCYDMPKLATIWDRMTINPEVEKAYYEQFEYSDIVISHSPPSGVLGVTEQGADIGSKELRKYIEKYQPKLLVCGHNHFSGAEVEMIGDTYVINTATTVNLLEVEVDRNGKWEVKLE